MRGVGRNRLVKLYWRGNKFSVAFTIIIVLIIVTYSVYGKIDFEIGKNEYFLRNELNAVEYADDLISKEIISDFDGKKIEVRKSIWLESSRREYIKNYLVPSVLISTNISSKDKKEILKIYDSSLAENGWHKIVDNKYQKRNLILSITFLENDKNNKCHWKVEVYTN